MLTVFARHVCETRLLDTAQADLVGCSYQWIITVVGVAHVRHHACCICSDITMALMCMHQMEKALSGLLRIAAATC